VAVLDADGFVLVLEKEVLGAIVDVVVVVVIGVWVVWWDTDGGIILVGSVGGDWNVELLMIGVDDINDATVISFIVVVEGVAVAVAVAVLVSSILIVVNICTFASIGKMGLPPALASTTAATAAAVPTPSSSTPTATAAECVQATTPLSTLLTVPPIICC